MIKRDIFVQNAFNDALNVVWKCLEFLTHGHKIVFKTTLENLIKFLCKYTAEKKSIFEKRTL